MNASHSFLRLLLGWISAGHVSTGLLLISGKRGIRLAARLYGARFEPTDQFKTIIRPAGAFVLALGVLQGMAIREPRRYKGVIDATLLVLLIRQFQRLAFRRDIYGTFDISPTRHWIMTGYFAALTALLVAARASLADEAE